MTDFFVPWDATDDEIAGLHAFEELVPKTLLSPLKTWLRDELSGSHPYVSISTIHLLQVTLRDEIDHPETVGQGLFRASEIADAIAAKGDQFLMRAVDWVVSEQSQIVWEPDEPEAISSLRFLLDRTGSKAAVVRLPANAETGNFTFRLAHRLPVGASASAEHALSSASSQVRKHLDRAWSAYRQLEPDTSKAMSEAVKAAELAMRDVLAPKDGRPRMIKFANQLKEQTNWRINIDVPSQDAFDPRELMVQAIRGLALSQVDRHGGEPPHTSEALTHLMLASFVVGWFESGTVTVETKQQRRPARPDRA